MFNKCSKFFLVNSAVERGEEGNSMQCDSREKGWVAVKEDQLRYLERYLKNLVTVR